MYTDTSWRRSAAGWLAAASLGVAAVVLLSGCPADPVPSSRAVPLQPRELFS